MSHQERNIYGQLNYNIMPSYNQLKNVIRFWKYYFVNKMCVLELMKYGMSYVALLKCYID